MSLQQSASAGLEPAAVGKPSRDTNGRNGVLAALGAYTIWGFLPLLFREIEGASPLLIVAERTVWSMVVLTGVLIVSGGFGELRTFFADRKRVLGTMISSALLAINWLFYVWAVESGQVLEASFGYFINPLVNVLMGMILLGERQNRLQTISIVIAAVAITIQAVALGSFPVVAVGLALSFGFYGYFRKTAQLGPATGLFAETAMLVPMALGFIIFTVLTTGPGVHADPYSMTMLVMTGPATAIPLLFFAFAVRRLRLTTIGMFQYIAPSIAFLLAILVFGEHLNGWRLASFVLIWISLALFSYDSFQRRGQVRA